MAHHTSNHDTESPAELEKRVLEFSTSESIEEEVPKLFRVGYIVLWLVFAACLVETVYKYVPRH